MPCGHEDWPCCGCGDDLEHFDDSNLCQGCGEPEAFCRCDGDEDNSEGDDSMEGDHESGLASAGFGTDEDYGYYGDLDCDG